MLLKLLGKVIATTIPRCPLLPSDWLRWESSSLSPTPSHSTCEQLFSLTNQCQPMVLNSFRQALHPSENRYLPGITLIFLNLNNGMGPEFFPRLPCTSTIVRLCPCGPDPQGRTWRLRLKMRLADLKTAAGARDVLLPRSSMAFFLHISLGFFLSLLNSTEMCSQLNRPCQKTQDLLE